MLRTSKAIRLGIHPRTLYALRDAGDIEQVGRGLYRLSTPPPLSSPDLAPIAMVDVPEVTPDIDLTAQVETSIGAVSRIKTFSEKVKSENLDGEDMELPEEWPDQGSIKIRGVSASYG